jgi:hypothetical protein
MSLLSMPWRWMDVMPRGVPELALDDGQRDALARHFHSAIVEPQLDLLPAPAVHACLAGLVALAAANQNAAGGTVQVALGERERR